MPTPLLEEKEVNKNSSLIYLPAFQSWKGWDLTIPTAYT